MPKRRSRIKVRPRKVLARSQARVPHRRNLLQFSPRHTRLPRPDRPTPALALAHLRTRTPARNRRWARPTQWPTSSSSAPSSPPVGLSLPFSFGSSSSSTSSNSSIGGTPADSSASSSSSIPPASPSGGQAGNSKSDASSSDDFVFAPAPKRAAPQKSIEVPFEVVVVCRRKDVLLHPGGYRLTTQVMTQKKPAPRMACWREIVAMVRKRAIVDPLIRPKPKIRYSGRKRRRGNILGRPPPAHVLIA